MSSNSSIDNHFHYLIKLIIGCSKQFGLFCLPYIMASYLYGIECWHAFCNQLSRTIQAIYQSFFQDELYMYEDQSMHYPVIRTSKTSYNLIYGNLAWIYVPSEQAFYNTRAPTLSKHHSSYIGASVTQLVVDNQDSVTSVPLGDMTEWLGDQLIWSDSDQVPFQVLLLAWAYHMKISIAVNFPSYHITVMNMEGNEITIDVATEQPIEPSSRSSSVASETNIPPPPSPCMSPHVPSLHTEPIDEYISSIEYPPNRPEPEADKRLNKTS